VQKTFEKLFKEVTEGAANWVVMTNRYFDAVEQQDVLNKADKFFEEVRHESILCIAQYNTVDCWFGRYRSFE